MYEVLLYMIFTEYKFGLLHWWKKITQKICIEQNAICYTEVIYYTILIMVLLIYYRQHITMEQGSLFPCSHTIYIETFYTYSTKLNLSSLFTMERPHQKGHHLQLKAIFFSLLFTHSIVYQERMHRNLQGTTDDYIHVAKSWNKYKVAGGKW